MDMKKKNLLRQLGLKAMNPGACAGTRWISGGVGELPSVNPATEEVIATATLPGQSAYEEVVEEARRAFLSWRLVPAPKRGQIVREITDELRRKKDALGRLVSLETGKIFEEGRGEVEEMINSGDRVVGLSRDLNGLTIPSERVGHLLRETWHPLGPVGVITAFNFPVAVWSWNALLAAVCGDTVIWKPSPKTPLSAIAVQNICNAVCEKHGISGVFNLCLGGRNIVGEMLVRDPRISLISATGSCAMGREVASIIAGRLGRAPILELGGNNAVIVMNDANLPLAASNILFGAVGTAGQRCTTTRRVIAHKAIAVELRKMLVAAFGKVKIGDPLSPRTLMGPLIDADAVENMMEALRHAVAEGGQVLCGGKRISGKGFFVEPAIVAAHRDMSVIKKETFAPILYFLECESLEEAIALNNDVPQGLSSAIFTESIRHAETFLGPTGSDCGLANVNTGTSGAEIGGAFGGEKDTGGGREAGSNAWQWYMRRQTTAINYSGETVLAQGIQFVS